MLGPANVARIIKEDSKAKYASVSSLDYTILSVVVMTLLLMLFLQLVRDKLDTKAARMPFLRTVLEGVYAELALLGIVELVIFLLYKFNAGLDKATKEVFADVHFTLFFTALFNAFQSGIMAFFISRNSYKLWVKIEYQDLHHYVEIREEFDAVCKELSRTLVSAKSKRIIISDTNYGSDTESLSGGKSTKGFRGSEIQFTLTNLERFWEILKQKARFPHLAHRHQSLLVQVRFHELKFHFIQANNLPITLRLSDYMKRCERHILLKMVHISPFKWLIFTGAIDVLYFVFGAITFHADGKHSSTNYALDILFFGSMIFFVLLSLIIWNKVSWIFHTIMHTKLISYKAANVAESTNDPRVTDFNDTESFDQLSLFWGRNTKYITIMIQSMQFGFALALSILLIFWFKIDSKDVPKIPVYYYLVSVLLCFSCFVYIMSHVVPRFTLCSSIGQMVDKTRLHETLARHRLEVALRERQLILSEQAFKESVKKTEEDFKIQFTDSLALPPHKANKITISSMDPTLLEELVKTKTEDLRKNLPSQDAFKLDEKNINSGGGRNRHETLLEGVGIVADMSSGPKDNIDPNENGKYPWHLGKKSLSESDSIQMIRDMKTLSSTLNDEQSPHSKPQDDLHLFSGRLSSERKKTRFEELGEIDSVAYQENSLMYSSLNDTTIEIHKENLLDVLTQTDSYDDDRSDAGDVPDVREVEKQKESLLKPKRTVFSIMRSYFRSRKYVVFSSVFGTMLCFFLVGLRLEAVMIETGVLIDSRNTWHLKPNLSFWFEVCFLVCFLVGDCLVLYILRPSKWLDVKDRRLFIAGLLDLLICSLCLALLMTSQAIRCCNESEKRFLVEDSKSGEGALSVVVECCPAFGNRMYGGFGNIEMFTSLIILRLLRFWVARVIVKTFDGFFLKSKGSKESDDQLPNDDFMEREDTLHPFDPLHDPEPKEMSHDDLNLQKITGTIVDLWKLAVSKHPDIVEKYGEFSGPLLQAMLGIPILEDDAGNQNLLTNNCIERKESRDTASFSPPCLNTCDQSYQSLYSGRSMQPSVINTEDSNFEFLPKSYLNRDDQKVKKSDVDPALGGMDRPRIDVYPLNSNKFPLFDERTTLTNKGEDWVPYDTNKAGQGLNLVSDEMELLSFASPNARLIRSMRRCDRKVLPMLDRWLTVDVVLTNYEIVYFDANDSEKLLDDSSPVGKRMNEIHQAIVATKGGKGLRLRDVAFGRKIVGTEILTDIEEIHVHRVMPHDTQENDDSHEQQHADEFWKCRDSSKTANCDVATEKKLSLHARWSHVKEDQLRLRTAHSTLYLRFYGDLEYCETHMDSMMKESEAQGPLFKNNAFQWGQTIGRLVGSGRLRQELPHFGDDTIDEARDYLVVVDHHQQTLDRSMVGRFKRVMSHRSIRSESLLSHSTSEAAAKATPSFSLIPFHRRRATELPVMMENSSVYLNENT